MRPNILYSRDYNIFYACRRMNPEEEVFQEILAQDPVWREEHRLNQNRNRRARNLLANLSRRRQNRNNLTVNSNNNSTVANNNTASTLTANMWNINSAIPNNNRSTVYTNAEEVYNSNGGRRRRTKKTRKSTRRRGHKSRRFCRK